MKWTKQEDKLLSSIYDGKKTWNELTEIYNKKTNYKKKYKQLHQRWKYFLDPKLLLSPLSKEEENIIKYNFFFNNHNYHKIIKKKIYKKTSKNRSSHFIKNSLSQILRNLKKSEFSLEEDIQLCIFLKNNDFLWKKIYEDFNNIFSYKTIFELKYRWEFHLKKYSISNNFSEEEDNKLYNICIDKNINWNQIYDIFNNNFPNKKTYVDLIHRWILYLDPELNPIYIN